MNLNINWISEAIRSLKDWHPILKSNFQSIQNDYNNHTAGSTDKHTLSHIDNDSSVAGTTAKDALNTLKALIENLDSAFSTDVERINAINQAIQTAFNADDDLETSLLNVIATVQAELTAHKNTDEIVHPSSKVSFDTSGSNLSSILVDTVIKELNNKVDSNKTTTDTNLTNHQNSSTAHGSSSITNQSNVVGAKVTDALNQLKSTIDTIVANVTVDSEVQLARNSATKSVNYPTLDNRLEAIEVDVENTKTPTYSTESTQTLTIMGLPVTTYKSPFNKFLVRGRTITNLLGSDGDFEVDTDANGVADGWTRVGNYTNSINSLDVTDRLFSNKSQKLVRNTAVGLGIEKNIAPLLISGRTYFFMGYGKAVNSTAYINLSSTSSAYDIYQKTLTAGQGWVKAYKRFTYTSGNVHINTFPVLDTAYFDGFALYDLTAIYGAGNEPDEATAEKQLNFINNTQSVGSMKIKSVGKNLFPETNYNNFIKSGSSSVLIKNNDGTFKFKQTSTSASNVAVHIPVKNNTAYTVKLFDVTNVLARLLVGIVFLDKNQAAIGTTSYINSDGTLTFTKAAVQNSEYIRIAFASDGQTTINEANFNIMLVEGSSAPTIYEPYTETVAYIVPPQGTNKSLPNGVTDAWDVLKGTSVQNVSDWVTLDGSKEWNSGFIEDAGFKVFTVNNILTSYVAPINIQNKINVIKHNNISLSSTTVSATTGDQVFGSQSANARLAVSVFDTDSGFPDSYSPLQNEIKAYFYGWKMCNPDGSTPWDGVQTKNWKKITDGTGLTSTLPTASYSGYSPYKMIYQLATPIPTTITNLAKQLIAEPSGTIIGETAYTDVSPYGTNITVNSSYPAKSIGWLNKIDTNTGVFTPIDLSKVTIAADGLSFTITGATAGEWYEFEVQYDSSLSPVSTKVYSHATDLKAQADCNTKAIAKIDDKVEDIGVRLESNNFLTKSTSGITYYVNASTGLDTNDGLSSGTAFKTISAAIAKIPQCINHSYTINVANGTYTGISLSGFVGNGSITITGASNTNTIIDGIDMRRNSIFITISTVKVTGFGKAIEAWGSSWINVSNCVCDGINYVNCVRSNMSVSNCTITNSTFYALSCQGGTLFSDNNTGSNPSAPAALYATNAGTIGKSGTQPTGSVNELAEKGGVIR